MDQTAHIVSLYYFLTILAKNYFKNFMKIIWLLVILIASDSALKHDEAYLENIKRSLGFKIGGLTDWTFHEVFLGHVHLEDAE